MKAAAERGAIHVIVNCETTWYPANQTAYVLVHDRKAIGDMRWNWPFDRKDMELYGRSGQLMVPAREKLRARSGDAGETEPNIPMLTDAQADPLSYLAAVVRGEIQPAGPSSIEVNMVVTEILDAARASARTGKRIDLPAKSGTTRRSL